MRNWGEGPAGLTEKVRRNRIRLAVAAWAYENDKRPTMSDAEYDRLSVTVDTQRRIATGNSRLDNFFRRQFDPSTGLWVHKHPNKAGLERIYYQVHYPRLYPEDFKRARQRARRAARKNR